MLVAHAALAAASRNPLLARFGQVREDVALFVLDDCAARNANNQIFGRCTGAALGATGLTALCLVNVRVAHVEKRGVLLVHLQNHVTATTAITAIGTAEGYKLFTMETADAVTASAGANFNIFFV